MVTAIGTNSDCSGQYKQSAQSPPLHDPEYKPIRHPYVPAWLPWREHREFLRRLHASLARANANRGGRWRNSQDEVETRWHILGGLASSFKGGRVSSGWGRRMRGKKGQKALQARLANQGQMLVDYFARIGRRGGLAKARNRREAALRTMSPEQRQFYEHQRRVFSERHPPKARSWLLL